MTVDVSQFHRVFFEESLEHLANMESGLLELERGGNDPEVVNVIFRGAHSIKGGSSTFGFQAVAEFTHHLEAVLERIRSGNVTITPAIITVLLESVDALRDMIAALQSGGEHEISSIGILQNRLTDILDACNDTLSRASDTEYVTAAEVDPDDGGWRIRFKPHRHFFETGNDPHRILRELATLGCLEVAADVSGFPSFSEMNPEECYLGWDMVLRGRVDRDQIDEIFAWVAGDCDLNIEPFATDPRSIPRELTPVGPHSGDKSVTAQFDRRTGQDRRHGEGESIRVSIEKIDTIINMVGELVITQSMLSQVGETVQDSSDIALESLRDGLVQLERNTRELQEGVMRIRMLPISFAFSRFPRLVHDLSTKLGKEVELKLSGEHTELDKTVMEKIGDPLVHLVRNALDHGIETPEARRSQGKPGVGQIHLNAFHQGGNIVIEVSDDGAGLNRERIVAKARERGLLPEAGDIDEERMADLIFDPGFTTAVAVSDVSGRGVGMDVVRRNIRDLGGSVEVKSEAGRGSRFTIRLPLTLAILDGQLVRVGSQVYVAPLVSIVESLQVRAERVNVVAGGAPVYRLRDDYIPIMDLRSMFGFAAETSSLSDCLLVVVEGDGKKIGLVVDDLLGQQQVVIKSLDSNYRAVDGVSGATILGDGTVALILDAGQLVSLATRNATYRNSISGKATIAA